MRLVILSLSFAFALTACAGEDAAAPLTTAERLALPADADAGARAARICRTCHEVAQGTGHRVGPNLWGILGTPAGQHADFRYSKALERSGIVWDAQTMDAYLANPQAVIPGGRMAYAGMPNEADRRDVIAYLETLN